MEREKFSREKERKDVSMIGQSSDTITSTTESALEGNLSREAALLHALFADVDDIIDMDWDAIYALPTIEEMKKAVAQTIKDKAEKQQAS